MPHYFPDSRLVVIIRNRELPFKQSLKLFYCSWKAVRRIANCRASEASETLSGLFNRESGIIVVRAISVYSAGVPYAARFTAAVKIPLPLATFQF